jgi:hypothetical protein
MLWRMITRCKASVLIEHMTTSFKLLEAMAFKQAARRPAGSAGW